MSQTHLGTGRSGEKLARSYLEQRGLQTVEMNWRCSAGELDLVMLDDDVLVFIEVKTRKTYQAGSAEESVSPAKARRLLATGDWYVNEHPEHESRFWRIDIMAITMGGDGTVQRLTHIPNAISSG